MITEDQTLKEIIVKLNNRNKQIEQENQKGFFKGLDIEVLK